MKSHELARSLELVAKLLRELPDDHIEPTLEMVLSHVRGGIKREKANRKAADRGPVDEATVNRVIAMRPSEVEQYLSSSDEFADTARIRELAKRLGIAVSQRQSRAALANLIARSLEGRTMDRIIRGRSLMETQSTMSLSEASAQKMEGDITRKESRSTEDFFNQE